ncbi:hypothetical protein LguiA_008079 [Lonicera macranthoides]
MGGVDHYRTKLDLRGPMKLSALFLPSDIWCFSLVEIKSSTNNLDDNLVIGVGGFSNVYKGYLDKGATTVPLKELKTPEEQCDYGSEKIECVSFVDVSLAGLYLGMRAVSGFNFYYFSLAYGYNLPMMIAPQCRTRFTVQTWECILDLSEAYSSELKMMSTGREEVACKSTCDVLGDEQYYCSGAYSISNMYKLLRVVQEELCPLEFGPTLRYSQHRKVVLIGKAEVVIIKVTDNAHAKTVPSQRNGQNIDKAYTFDFPGAAIAGGAIRNEKRIVEKRGPLRN